MKALRYIRNKLEYGRQNVANVLAVLAALLCGVHFADAQQCDPVPKNIVSWWSGENNALDNFGLNNGTFEGTPAYAPGEVGSAFSFNGANQYVLIPNSSSLQFTRSITLEAWIYPLSYNSGSSSSVLCKWDAIVNVNQRAWSFGVDGPGPGFFGISSDGVNGTYAYTTNQCPLDTWSHLAATYDGTNIDIYLNGVQEAATPFTNSIIASTDNIAIGAVVGGGGPIAIFNGYIDEVSIYNRALSASEIQAIYTAGSAGKCPNPLTITSQPSNETVTVNEQTVFSLAFTGYQPVTCQWYFGGNEITNATNASLVLTNVQTNQAGAYYAIITDGVGDTLTSSNATLTVNPVGPCYTAPANLVSWWSGDGNTLDNAGGNNGYGVNSPSYAAGIVGQAFSFNGDQCVRVPDAPNLHFTNAFTAEAWIYPTQSSAANSILVKFDGTPGVNQSAFSFSLYYTNLYLNVSRDGVPSDTTQLNSSGSVPLNEWTYVASTYDGSNIRLYINGVLDSVLSYTGGIYPGTDNMAIGANVGGLSTNSLAAGFYGLIDEPAVYNRALSAAEIQAIYAAYSSGKCPVSFPPVVYAQPAGKSVFPGSNVTFTASVSGSPALTYQWQFNTTNISGATNLSLTLTNVTTANAGNYSLLASNSFGTNLSSNAVLRVNLVTIYANGKALTNSQYAFSNPITVSMTNYFTNGDIFYTTNGTVPTPGSTLYSGSFALSNNSTIQALGYSGDFQQSSLTPPVTVTFPPVYSLSATTPGGGSITVSPSGTNFLGNTAVTIIATASNGWTFLEWLGNLGGTNASNTIVMDGNKSVQAIFGTMVGASAGGSGAIVFNPAGGVYPFGTVLQVSAVPQLGSYFVLWGESASGNTNPLSFHVTNANPAISALFTSLGSGQVALAVVPIGHGTVSLSPQANSYATGSTVTVTATAALGHAFLGWSGSAAGTNNPLNFQLNESATIYANFTTNNSMDIYPVTPPGTGDGMAIDLNGETGVVYRLDASTNFSNWTTLYTVTNAVGTLHYIDLTATNLPYRFYRGVILP